MKIKKQVIVAGGRAAGVIAAISARRLGAEVTILERNPQFAHRALSNFTIEETLRFFEKLGIEPK